MSEALSTVTDGPYRERSPSSTVVTVSSSNRVAVLPCAPLDKRMRLVSGGYSFSLSLSISLSLSSLAFSSFFQTILPRTFRFNELLLHSRRFSKEKANFLHVSLADVSEIVRNSFFECQLIATTISTSRTIIIPSSRDQTVSQIDCVRSVNKHWKLS